MVNVKKVVSFDLAKYGMEGTIEVAHPSFRRRHEIENESGKCYNATQTGKDGVDINVARGDIAVLNKLLYIRKAPFPISIEGYLSYMDIVDAKEFGNADLLDERIDEAINELFSEAESPFVDSPAEETTTSD